MNEEKFIEELKKIGITLSNDQIKKFRLYAEFLLDYNTHTNLTAIKSVEDIYLKHFYDSLLLVKFFEINDQSLLDIGTGAGFPGVPLKICFPSIELTTLDSNGKKTKFLEELKLKLGVDFKVVNERAEIYIKDNREAFDIVTGRAVTAMPVLAEISLPFVKVNGYFISYKGNLDNTLENGTFAIESLGGEVQGVHESLLPTENSKRTFVVILKKCKTSEQYPRSFEKITKKPLQKR